MPYPGTPEFSQLLLEMQLTMWEAVALVLAFGAIVSCAIILGSLAWLCFRETRGVPVKRIAQEPQAENKLATQFAHQGAGRARMRSWTGEFAAQCAARPRRTLLRFRR